MSIFSEIQNEKVNYSTFNLSHQRKFTFNAGKIVPSLMQECIPGDSWNISTNQLMRMMPMLAPVMHEVQLTNHTFFVPLRLLWKEQHFQDFITGGEDGMKQVAFPTIKNVPANGNTPETYTRNRLADYLGLPNVQDQPVAQECVYDEINPFPFLAYQRIYFEYYRDQNLTQFDLDDLDITTWTGYPMLDWNNLTPWQQDLFTTLRTRAWQHDYFTSCLPFPQKGMPVKMPLGDHANIIFNLDNVNAPTMVVAANQNEQYIPADNNEYLRTDSQGKMLGDDTGSVIVDNSHNLLVDLQSASSATIIEMRKAIVLQQWMEKRARTGSRYIEYVKADFNVNSSDARLQRPEFCGGTSTPILISETLQQSATTEDGTPQGNMAGHGVSMGGNFIASKFCEEHGFMIMLTTVMPKTGYHQGMPKLFKKFDKFDYGTPIFQHVGEQEVSLGEVYYRGADNLDSDVFGYIPRYSEYKFINNSVHGYFKNSLGFWTWDRKFENAPALNSEFIECTPTRDIFALIDEEEDTLLCQMFHTIDCKRALSYYSSPSLERL